MSVQTPGFTAPLLPEPARETRVLSTPAFDWIYLVLILLVEVGFSLDAWSHTTYGPDQSVLSEYHMLMYGAVGVLSAYLTYIGATRMREGASWRTALPAGFGIGYIGLLAFGISGVVDLIGHALFGFEAGIEARMSPSHLGLFVGLTLLRLALPLAAGARQRAATPQRWVDYVPSMISVSLLFQLFNLLLPGAPLNGRGREWPTQAARGAGDFLAYDSGLSGILILTIGYIGLMVGVLRRVRLPFGSLTVISAIPPLLATLQNSSLQFLPAWLAAGLAGDVVLLLGARWLKNEVWTLRLFGLIVPLVLWGSYFTTLILTEYGGGVWWSGYIWTGTVVQAAATGFMIAVLATLPGRIPAEGETP
jgi:hypothetical protein